MKYANAYKIAVMPPMHLLQIVGSIMKTHYGICVNLNSPTKERIVKVYAPRQIVVFTKQSHHVDALITESNVLEYIPPWYQRGDPDHFVYVVLHGFIALATIWLLEYICKLILYSTAKGILSDAAAHIALNNLNWLGIAR